MYEMEAQFGMFPGKAVPRVKASDIKAVWKFVEEAEAQVIAHNPEFKRGQVAFGVDVTTHVCTRGANTTAVSWRSMKLGMLMRRLGKRDARPPAILFAIYAKFPMKWWAFGESHRSLF